MPLYFFGLKKKEKEEEAEVDERLLGRTKEILSSYGKLSNSVLIDTVRITEGLLDRTGLSDIDRTLWGAEFPRADAEEVAVDKENLNAVLKCIKRFYHCLATMDAELTPLNYRMQELLEHRGNNFANYGNDEIAVFRKAAKCSEEIRQILLVDILDDNGKLTDKAREKAEQMLDK